jgi:hypothetical protein
VEAANHNIDACLSQRASNINGARKFVRLDADETDKPEILIAPESPDDRRDPNACVGLIHRPHGDSDTGAEYQSPRRAKSKPVEHRERVRRHRRSQPTNDVTLLVVVRWFDE